MYGQQIIRIVTNRGEIVIDTKVDDIKIEVIENGAVIQVIDLATQQSIDIKAGQYEIRPVGENNSIRIDNNKLSLTRGGQEIVTITRNESAAGNSTLPSSSDSRPNIDDPMVPYRLVAGDVLGVFIEGVLGEFDQAPPVHYPAPQTGLPPSMGFPIVVEYDGRISIPFIDRLEVSGKTIAEVRRDLISAFQEGEAPILNSQARILVSLMQKRSSGMNLPPAMKNRAPQYTLENQIAQTEIQLRAAKQQFPLPTSSRTIFATATGYTSFAREREVRILHRIALLKLPKTACKIFKTTSMTTPPC